MWIMPGAKLTFCLFILTAVSLAQDKQTQDATDGNFTVASQAFQDFPFSVGEGVKNVRLSGEFTATGGTSSLIVVVVMNDDQYARWQKKKSGDEPSTPANGGALYNSGRVTHGTIDLRVPDTPAIYHLVFNNQPFQYAKTIQSNLQWEWHNTQ